MSYLGMRITRGKEGIRLSMEAYIEDMLKEYGKVERKATPAKSDLFELPASEELNESQKQRFHRSVAKLLYLAKRTRFDILLATIFLATRVKCPTKEDQNKLDRVMGYLSGTKTHTLRLTCTDMTLRAFIDASYGTHHDGKSHSGMTMKLGAATIAAISRKQKIVTKSSTEAELVALSDLLPYVEKCTEFMHGQGYTLTRPIVLQDNTSTINLVTGSEGTYRNKYMRVRQAYVKERVDQMEIRLAHIPTGGMLADGLTKPLQGALGRAMTKHLLGN
jgi:hypothetical protein